MNTRQLIEAAYMAYRQSGDKVYVPDTTHAPTPGYVRLSAMDNCALRHAYEKLGVEPDFPELTPEHNLATAWIMDHGNYVAPMIQEALIWHCQQNGTPYAFGAEIPVRSEELKAVGRLDGLIEVYSHELYQSGPQTFDTIGRVEKRILEIKDAEGFKQRSVGEPRLSHCLQALAYCLVTGVKHASIVIVSKWGFRVYDLEPVDPVNGRYELQNPDGSRYYPSEPWMENFNDPDILSFARVKDEIAELHQQMSYVQHRIDHNLSDLYATAPITDPLNHPKGWLCLKHSTKPTKTKDGTAYVNCPWAKRCHGLNQLTYNTRKDEEGKYVLVNDF